ncbi:MAG: hypothetical protein J5959_00975 [Butyrivibrio sp.]|nr:hypothetical protein [Butyrivibrio sp.]MBP3239866.1 hypothetical protein [Oribacterium sp.]
MTYTPDMGKAFINSYRTTMNSDQVITEIEKVSVTETESITEDKKFVIDAREGNFFRLFSVKDILKNPKSKTNPIVEITVKDSEEDNGATIEYKLDVQKNLFSVALMIIMTCAFIGAVIWLACALFVSFDVFGIIASSLLAVISVWVIYKIGILSTSSILGELVSVIPIKR